MRLSATSERNFFSLQKLIVSAAESVRPPERLTVSQAAEKYRYLNNPGSYVGPWTNKMTPYLIEPMDMMTSQDHEAVIFVGPAQCGKTDMFLNWLSRTVICEPMDMMLVEKSQAAARDFSYRRIDRLHRFSREVKERLIQRRNADNAFDKRYTSGMLLTLSWPTINELSGKPIALHWLSDYDRMDQDVDGEGSPFDLTKKRGTTFKSYAMTVAESSPGFMVENTQYTLQSPHEAPPCPGVLALYNRGDRRRFMWPCVTCDKSFEGDFSLLKYPDSKDFVESAEAAEMMCPHCGTLYPFNGGGPDGLPSRDELNQMARWVPDHCTWDSKKNEITGPAPKAPIASFWLKGVAATFVSWKDLVLKFLNAEAEYDRTGSEEALKTTVNTDQGLPYVSKVKTAQRLAENIKAKARNEFGEKVVPTNVRVLVATVDVQKSRFVVQVMGFGEGMDMWIIDRFDIRKSERLDDDDERIRVDPGAYLEDWDLLIDQVLLKTYPVQGHENLSMRIKIVGCDSGGKEGVTNRAYQFWRKLSRSSEEGNLQARFILLKGASQPSAPTVEIKYPDSGRKDRHAGARGEVPVLMMNTNILKDSLNKMLDRDDPGGGKVNFPSWLDDNFYKELTVEVRTPKGWENPNRFRNESWDLMVYALALGHSRLCRLDVMNWEDAPGWAKPIPHNDLVFQVGAKEDDPSPGGKSNRVKTLGDLGEMMG